MTDMTTITVIEPEHYPVVVLFSTGVARKYRVIARSPEKAVALIRAHCKPRIDDGNITQVFAEKQVQEHHTTFVKEKP